MVRSVQGKSVETSQCFKIVILEWSLKREYYREKAIKLRQWRDLSIQKIVFEDRFRKRCGSNLFSQISFGQIYEFYRHLLQHCNTLTHTYDNFSLLLTCGQSQTHVNSADILHL